MQLAKPQSNTTIMVDSAAAVHDEVLMGCECSHIDRRDENWHNTNIITVPSVVNAAAITRHSCIHIVL